MSMDTITRGVLLLAANRLEEEIFQGNTRSIHTMTITLNGAHGGADVRMQGEYDSGDYYDETIEVH